MSSASTARAAQVDGGAEPVAGFGAGCGPRRRLVVVPPPSAAPPSMATGRSGDAGIQRDIGLAPMLHALGDEDAARRIRDAGFGFLDAFNVAVPAAPWSSGCWG